MLYEILQAHGGKLPADVLTVFCNTGKERNETLDFVERCSVEWSVPIVWLEYRNTLAPSDNPRHVGGHSFAVVDYQNASRNGEPFTAIIEAFGRFREQHENDPVLPNVRQRFCTVELKMRTLERYIDWIGWEDGWTDAIGFRADERERVRRANSSKNRWEPAFPLAQVGITEGDVLKFWARQPFDLAIKSYAGNCDFCFLKSQGKIERLMRENPAGAAWWVKLEEATGQRFRNDRPSYAALLARSQRASLPMMGDDEPDELGIACHCTD
jgi:3'-phosphoadenosine 5'-phosphosulfate sulfotransferase (PAPS reductase)/FAD synthetase